MVITFNERIRPTYLAAADLERLSAFAEPVWVASEDEQVTPELAAALDGAAALVGLPRGAAGGRGLPRTRPRPAPGG